MVKIRLPDGSEIEGEAGKRIVDIIPKGSGLVARINGVLVDLTRIIEPSFKEIEILDFSSEEGKAVYWHTTSHVMAHAVKRLYPYVKLGIGPPVENGFYYDFDTGGIAFIPEDLEKIEKEMKRIIEEDLPLKREEMKRSEAIRLFEKLGEKYKVELLEEMSVETVTVYRQGDFVDLCRGPHLPSTGYVKYFKLLTASSSYWRGDERNPVMQRIYGISFPKKSMLEEYLTRLEEARRRDHRRIGVQLDLFSMPSETIGPGLVLWHPKGALVRKIIEDFLREVHLKNGYQLVYTPHIAYGNLWEISGHLSYYRDLMYYFEKEGVPHVVKPMNCPFHILIYKSKTRSYRDLPIRYFELGTVYRYERSGTLHGLMRVRGFTQDDAHIFCTEEQLENEVVRALDLMEYILSAFGFKKYEVELSTWEPSQPEKYMGSPEIWENAENALKRALEKKGYSFKIMPGEAAFYGPKIDVKLIDAIGRKWQCTTIQVDFNLPVKFNITYVDKDGKEKTVVMIHRALLGSIERFFGILIEHYAGDFPLWLAPVQARIIPVSDKYRDYAHKICEVLSSKGIRVEVDDSSAALGYKIRQGELEKIPYLLIVGRREEKNGTVSVRRRKVGDLGAKTIDEFIKLVEEELKILQ
ncbi:MAG: threonine--tRNA ligase [Thermoprotei archaeon]|nr:MAG: threonine--tRNA ligase [Thermoprotei archaeon]